MSQFEAPPDQYSYADDSSQPPPRTSGLAIASLVCSLICCLPLTTIPAIFLGVGALVAMSGKPHLRGRGLAVAGIVLGLIFTIGQGVIGYGGYRAYVEVRDAPMTVLEPGFAGDYTALRDNFGSAGQQISDAEARAFIDELRSRYGELRGSEIDWEAYQGYQGPQPGSDKIQLFAVLVFERQSVDIEFTLDASASERRDETTFTSIRIIDPERGDLVFPPPPDEGAPAENSGGSEDE